MAKKTKKELEQTGVDKGKVKRVKNVKAYLPLFSMRIPYEKRAFTQLKKLGGEYEKEGSGIYYWTFPITSFDEVQSVLATKIEFETAPVKLALSHCPEMKKIVQTETDKQGNGYCIVHAETPEEFVVEYTQGGKEVRKSVPKNTVRKLYDVAIKEMEINQTDKTRVIWNRIILGFNLTDFMRESGSPDGSKLFGERGDYHRYFYSPIKVLQALGIVHHGRGGTVQKLAEWEDVAVEQSEFVETSMKLWGDMPMDKRGDITNWVEHPDDLPPSIKRK